MPDTGRKKENQSLEWKVSWRDEYLKWICAFANTEGGTLVIGRDDQGKAVGATDAKKLLEDLPNKIRDVLGIMVDVRLHTEKKYELIEIRVDAYPYPINYKGQYYYRSGSTLQELKGAALDRFLLAKQGKNWDGVPIPGVSVEDLDAVSIARFRDRAIRSKRIASRSGGDDEDHHHLLEKLHLTDHQYLKRASILLFHPEPQRFVTGAAIKIEYFRGDSDLAFQDEIVGNLFSQVDQVMELLLTKYLKAEISYQGLQREETYPVPEEALREAVLNAVTHKDYSGGAPVQIRVYPNKLVIWNEGQLPQGWTVERLMQSHPSKPFNPDIANAFFQAGLIESWGRGIAKILQASKDHGLPVPAIRADVSGLWLEFSYPPTGDSEQEKMTGKKLGEKLGERLGKRLGETRAAIVRAMVLKPAITIPELAQILSVSTTAIEKNISILKRDGYVVRVGAARGGAWKVVDPEIQDSSIEEK